MPLCCLAAATRSSQPRGTTRSSFSPVHVLKGRGDLRANPVCGAGTKYRRSNAALLRIRPRMTFIFGAAIALETEPVWGKTFAVRTPTVGFLADRASSIEQSLTTVGESGGRTPPDFADPEAACEADGGSSDPGGEEAARPRSRLRPGATCRALGRTRRRDRRGRRLGTRDGQRITTGLLLGSQHSTVDALEFRVWAPRLGWLALADVERSPTFARLMELGFVSSPCRAFRSSGRGCTCPGQRPGR